MVRSSRSRAVAAIAIALGIAMTAAVPLSAHRTDELLQAARLGIGPDLVRIELDVTPGIAVAERVLSDLDGDRDGAITPAEAQRYVAHVARALSLELDGAPLAMRLTGSTLPTVEAIRRGEGTLRIQLAAPIDRRAAGAHHLRYHNGYGADIGVYLANALVPASDRVAVTDQQRDVDQRGLGIDYVLLPDATLHLTRALLLSLAAAVLAIAMTWQRRRAACP